MLSKIKSIALNGLDGNLIEIQTDIGSGLPDFDIVGLPDTTMKEAKKRIKTAIKNSGIEFPNKKILINLAPANIRKEGINIIRKGRKHTNKSPSSNLPESHSGTISSIGHGIQPNMACRTVPLRLLQLCSMSMLCCSLLSYSTVLTVLLHGICIFSTSQRGYWAISLFRLSY